MKEDLTIAGPGSPISLKKFRKQRPFAGNKSFAALIDGTGTGIACDDDSILCITTDECSKQTLYYSQEIFDGKRIPMYLYRYMAYMFLDKELVKTDQLMAQEFIDGKIKEDSIDYITIRNLIKYADKNKEAQQLIGLIQLFSGTLNAAKKDGKPVSIYLEHPDSFLHPIKTARLMSMLNKIKDEYGLGELKKD